MAIKLSGEISIQDIVDEFGGIPPHGIDDYYRGGNKVSNNSYNQNLVIGHTQGTQNRVRTPFSPCTPRGP